MTCYKSSLGSADFFPQGQNLVFDLKKVLFSKRKSVNMSSLSDAPLEVLISLSIGFQEPIPTNYFSLVSHSYF
jgi:hypothetical protein